MSDPIIEDSAKRLNKTGGQRRIRTGPEFVLDWAIRIRQTVGDIPSEFEFLNISGSPDVMGELSRAERTQILSELDPALVNLRRFRGALTMDRSCASCGDRLAASRSDARYCSAACRQRAHRLRTSERGI
jgi:hypothetical protein